MEIVRLLESKNRCLKRFLELTEAFLVSARAGDLTDLESFQTRREAILKTLSLYDQRITELVSSLEHVDRSSELVESVERALLEKDRLVHLIVATDDRIIELIEQERQRIALELTQSQKSHSTLKKFKSSWAPGSGSGSGLDEKL
jgi:hypothetical protein